MGASMKYLIKFLKPYKRLLIIGPFFKLLEAIMELFLPYFMAKIIDNGVAGGDKNYILKMGAIMFFIALIGVCFALICQYSASLVSQGVGTDIRNAMFKHIGTFSNEELDKFGTSSLINRMTNDINQVQLSVAMLIRLVIRAPFLCIGGLVMSFILDYKLSLILCIVLPIFILILFITMKKAVPLYRSVQSKLDELALVLRENLSGVRVIRAFAKTDYERKRFANRNKEYADNAVRVGKVTALLNPLTNLTMNFAIAAIIWFGGIRVDTGKMTTGEVIAFVGYVSQILAALIVISNLVVIFTKAFASGGRVAAVFETKPSILNPDSIDVTANGKLKEQRDIIIEFKEVSFSYKNNNPDAINSLEVNPNIEDDNYHINNISFQIKRGETIGIIGGTGSGKSTIINLIPRFYDTIKGNIYVNGIDIKDYSLIELRNKIGIVPQKTVLFTGTIAENIRWGKKDATTEEIHMAAEIAQAAEFINRLPDGYNTTILRGGVNVSGGQRQRLTIARALVRNPEILILDDSFNALDYMTDAALRGAIQKYEKGITSLIVSQRASTIRNADQIIVLNEGSIAGIGKHYELWENCQVYKEICQSQEME
jgi:ATP-binding cassette, subfamily B, multidrug efflux pump